MGGWVKKMTVSADVQYTVSVLIWWVGNSVGGSEKDPKYADGMYGWSQKTNVRRVVCNRERCIVIKLICCLCCCLLCPFVCLFCRHDRPETLLYMKKHVLVCSTYTHRVQNIRILEFLDSFSNHNYLLISLMTY